MDLQLYQRPQPVIVDSVFKEKLRLFNEAINAEPDANQVKDHPWLKSDQKDEEGNELPVKYVPIEIVEEKLNYFFNGLWSTTKFKYSVIVNELVGDLELSIYHPEAGIWLTRAGAGGVIIQQRVEWETYQDGSVTKKRRKEHDFLDINRKVANTLTKDMGHLKTECIKNAAKSFGKSFGSGLNRGTENGLYADTFVTLDMVQEEIKDISSPEELKLYYETLPVVTRNDKRVKNLLKEKELQLKMKRNGTV